MFECSLVGRECPCVSVFVPGAESLFQVDIAFNALCLNGVDIVILTYSFPSYLDFHFHQLALLQFGILALTSMSLVKGR